MLGRVRLIGAIADVAVATTAVRLLGLHALVDDPEGVKVTGDVAEHGEEDVDEKIAGAAGQESDCCGREEDGDEDEENVRAADRHGFDVRERAKVGRQRRRSVVGKS